MAITIFERKKQRYLVPLLISVVIAIIFFAWYYFLAKPKPPITGVPLPREIKIKFEVLEIPILKEFQSFEEISPFEGEIGRENPFIPY